MKYGVPGKYNYSIAADVKNWKNTPYSNVRPVALANPLTTVASRIQYCMGRTPRVVLSQCFERNMIYANGDMGHTAKLLASRFTGEKKNNSKLIYHVVFEAAQWFTYANGDIGFINPWVNMAYGASEQGGFFPFPTNAISYTDYYKTYYFKYEVERSSFVNTYVNSTFDHNGQFKIMDIFVEEKERDDLDSEEDDYVDTGWPASTKYMISEKFDNLCSRFEDIRSNGLPIIFSWSALGVDETITASGVKGLVTDGDTYVNALDSSYSSRTANSPGAIFPAKYCGIGNISKTEGRKVPVGWAFLATATDSVDGVIRLDGPTGIADNYVEIPISGGAAWYSYSQADEAKVYFDSAIDNDADDTTRNKIDIRFKKDSATGYLIIHAFSMWIEDR